MRAPNPYRYLINAYRLIGLLFVFACSSEAPPTWRDAVDVWSDAWCDWAQRCYLDAYTSMYNDHDYCVESVTNTNCAEASWNCDARYPHKWELIYRCGLEMRGAVCASQFAPDVCYEAFR